MIIREQVPLSSLTTMRVGGPARFVAQCENEADIQEAIAFAHERAIPFMVLGGGSNLLASDSGYEGVVIQMRMEGIRIEDEGETVLLIADAGTSWDAFVREAAAQGLWGIENLAGIPGTVGAAPVQNIGAYGMEVAQTLAYVDVLDTKTSEVTRIANEDCGFEYRESRFKHDPTLVILRVAFRLARLGKPQTSYADLERYMADGHELATPLEIGDAVRAIRAKKFPDLSTHGTAGSFFKNPVISSAEYEVLKEQYPDMPTYTAYNGIKIPLAFVLDRILGLRGHREGNVHLFENQPLVLVAGEGATAKEIHAFANSIVKKVFDATRIKIEREVRSV